MKNERSLKIKHKSHTLTFSIILIIYIYYIIIIYIILVFSEVFLHFSDLFSCWELFIAEFHSKWYADQYRVVYKNHNEIWYLEDEWSKTISIRIHRSKLLSSRWSSRIEHWSWNYTKVWYKNRCNTIQNIILKELTYIIYWFSDSIPALLSYTFFLFNIIPYHNQILHLI